jgi:hypothetical protein
VAIFNTTELASTKQSECQYESSQLQYLGTRDLQEMYSCKDVANSQDVEYDTVNNFRNLIDRSHYDELEEILVYLGSFCLGCIFQIGFIKQSTLFKSLIKIKSRDSIFGDRITTSLYRVKQDSVPSILQQSIPSCLGSRV